MSSIGTIYDTFVLQCTKIVYPRVDGVSVTGRNTIIKRGWLLASDMQGLSSVRRGTDYITVALEKGHYQDLPSPIGRQWCAGVMSQPTFGVVLEKGVASFSLQNDSIASGVVGVDVGSAQSERAIKTFYAYEAVPGDTAESIAAALGAQIPGAIVNGAMLSVSGGTIFSVKLSGSSTVSQIVRRQRQRFVVTIWTDQIDVRDVLSTTLDLGLAQCGWVEDTSGHLIFLNYAGCTDGDAMQMQSVYRRDLVYDVDFATTETQISQQMIGFGGTITAGGSSHGYGEEFE